MEWNEIQDSTEKHRLHLLSLYSFDVKNYSILIHHGLDICKFCVTRGIETKTGLGNNTANVIVAIRQDHYNITSVFP